MAIPKDSTVHHLVLTLVFSFNTLFLVTATPAGNNVAALFIFGDSSADVGTNNFLPSSKAKANFHPYGIDLDQSSPTGRFSNGFNTVDFVAKFMGFKRSPPPFLSLSYYTDARFGVNFASAGSGILNSTGEPFVQFVSMRNQLRQFDTIYSNISAQMGRDATQQLLLDSVFILSTGSNDLFQTFTVQGPQEYHAQKSGLLATLVRTYKYQIRKLYQLGARKFGIISIAPIGCCPNIRRLRANYECNEDLNQSAFEFYHATEAMLKDLSHQLPGFKFALSNGYEIVMNLLKNSAALGFTEIRTACCGSVKSNAESNCLPTSELCSNRDKFFFWDMVHPSQSACNLVAQKSFGGSTKFVTPINFGQLVAA